MAEDEALRGHGAGEVEQIGFVPLQIGREIELQPGGP